MTAEPLEDRVLIHPLAGERQIGDITLPDSAKEDFRAGIVLSCGPGVNGTVKAGDKVLFGPFDGVPIQIGGEDFLVMRVGQIALRLIE